MPKVSLLVTKLRIPPQPQWAIARVHLRELLEAEVPRHNLTAVTAPAGYGKTTLLAEWARNSRLPVAWLSLAEEDNDLERFLRYLLAAWKEVQPEVAESRFGLLLSGLEPDIDAVLTALVNVGGELDKPLVIVLDDYHLISEAAIHQALTFLLDHLPPTLHVVLNGRGEPPLPLARYRARQQLFELWADDLRFSADETSGFLDQQTGLNLTPEDMARLYEQTEGWVAGLQLAALTLRHRRAFSGERPAVSGRNRFIADYLREDVLAYLPERVHRFLLQTSILERLCAPLCAAVTGWEESQEMLEELERENLFLMPLDASREWFRYHPLFAEFLQKELARRDPDLARGLHRRAARWHLVHELPEQAIRHAIAGDDVESAIEVFDRHLGIKLSSGELRLVQQWLDMLPDTWVATHPVLNVARAGLLAYTGAIDACIRCLDEAEERMAPAGKEEMRIQRARLTALRCFVACFQNDLVRAETLAARALRDLPEENKGFRPSVYGALGDTYRSHGRWEEAERWYLRALEVTDSPEVRHQSAHVFGALADLALRQGRLRAAGDYWAKALASVEEQAYQPALPLPVIGWLYIRRAEILYEWNQVAEAWEHVAQGLERAELGGDVRALIAGYLLAARVKLTEGDSERAAGYLEQARPLVEEASFTEWTSAFERRQLELWLAQDRLRAAVQWADEMLQSGRLAQRPESELAQLALASVLVVKGDSPSLERAQKHLASLAQTAEAGGRGGVVIESLALQAVAHWRRGDSTRAMTSLERALRLAEPEGYVRLFADLGLPIARLLHEAHSRSVMPDYVAILLAAFDGELVLAGPTRGPLPEPLTEREQEVLELLAAGLSNREIGEELVISPGTVKKHTSNIYGKLGVGSRSEAAARARELDLLD
jgi:LuxR family transcriptional regulator, maltose regulon positive regulatory protein